MEHLKAQILVPDSSSFTLKKTILTPKTHKIHSHKNFELNYILNGWGNRIVGDNIETFSNGDLVLIGPDLPHCWEVKGVSPGLQPECITIHFHIDFLGQKLMQSPEIKPMYDLINKSVLGIQFYGEEIFDAHYIIHKMLKANPFRRLLYLLEIFEILVRTNEQRILARAGFVDDVGNTDNEKLKKVYEYLLGNFSKKIKLIDLSTLCFMSPSAFCRFFERSTGKSLFSYLKEVRIGYACKLLQGTELSIADICYEAGFNNLSHFHNQFKEICVATPGQYRKTLNDLDTPKTINNLS
ncbi:MAG: AraC family transcriptional regulator [Prolixibacteraceae bacterium]